MIAAEFGIDADVQHGKLHEAYEPKKLTFALYPAEEAEGANVALQDTAIYVQVFLPWQKQRTAQIVVDPAPIEDAVQRFRERLRTATHPYVGSVQLWRIALARVDYGQDPVGNVNRAVMTLTAYGQNLAETAA